MKVISVKMRYQILTLLRPFEFGPNTNIKDIRMRISNSKELSQFTNWRVHQIDDVMFLLIRALCQHFFVNQTVLLIFLKFFWEFKSDNYDNSLVTVSGVSAVQKQSLVDVLQNRCQACNFIKKRLQHRCFPMKLTKFFCTTKSLLCWLLLAVNSVNQ